MSNTYFRFKKFTVHQGNSAMKVTTDACLFGAWAAEDMKRIQPARILDIGTGTGLLALMAAQVCSEASIEAAEIESGAAAQATDNFKASPWGPRIGIHQADIRDCAFTHSFDAIICNPPFYENELASPDAKRNMAHHGGGLVLQDLLPVIKRLLDSHGKAYLLLPAKRKEEIPELLEKNGLISDQYCRVRQSPKHETFRIMLRCGHDDGETISVPEQEFIIEEAPGRYTGAFILLLKDYYLHL
jgi:tRNA1Val (adenine37-N6)-methyltransferase